MACHKESHAERRNSLGMGDLAVERAEHTMEELRPSARRGLQSRDQKECCSARWLWTLPRDHSSAPAGMPDSIVRRDAEHRAAEQRQVSGPAVRGQSECQDRAIRVCKFAISYWFWHGPTFDERDISRCNHNFSIYRHYDGAVHSRFHVRVFRSFGDCEIRPEPQEPVRDSGEPGAGIRATARYDRKHQRTTRSRRPPRELLQCESAGSEYEPHGGTADVSRLTRARRVKESLLHCRYSHEPVRL